MRRTLLTAIVAAFAVYGWAQMNPYSGSSHNSATDNRLDAATRMVRVFLGPTPPYPIPPRVLRHTHCLAVIPNLTKPGQMIGSPTGSGFAICRTKDHEWSSPAPFTLTAAGHPSQIGKQHVQLVMLFMSDNVDKDLRSGHFQINGNLRVTNGPTNFRASAPNADILTYSRAGSYGGGFLKGATLQKDQNTTEQLYGHDVSFGSILNGQVGPSGDMQARDFRLATEHAEQTLQDW